MSRAVVIGACFVFAGCSTAERTVAPGGATASASVTSTHRGLTPNSIRYRDTGIRPATGRAGAAAIEARALLGRDGVTTIDVTTGSFDAPGSGTGTLRSVVLKGGTPSGSHSWTRSYPTLNAPSAQVEVSDLLRRASFTLQATVAGASGSRTGVVNATGVVARRPDVVVSKIADPGTIPLAATIPIVATVREANGDVGARFDCELYVDGALTSRARGAWVDAGDEVACDFRAAIGQPGAHQLEVRATTTDPADDDSRNNMATRDVVVSSGVPVIWIAHAMDMFEDYSQWDTTETLFLDTGKRERWTSLATYGPDHRWEVQVLAMFPGAVQVEGSRVRASTTAGTLVVHAQDFVTGEANEIYDWWNEDVHVVQRCFNTMFAPDPEPYVQTALCTLSQQRDGFPAEVNSIINYLWSFGLIRYQTTQVRLDRETGAVEDYFYTGAFLLNRSVGEFPGDVFDFDVALESPTAQFEIRPSVTLLPFRRPYGPPPFCFDWGTETQSSHSCAGFIGDLYGREGWAAEGVELPTATVP